MKKVSILLTLILTLTMCCKKTEQNPFFVESTAPHGTFRFDQLKNEHFRPAFDRAMAEHKAEIEAPYHKLTGGGHIFYVEIDGDATHNPQSIMQIVDLMDKYDIGYGSVNHNRNRCLNCGHEDATNGLEVCPKCGSTNIDKLQRITGYLVGTTDRWNSAKLAELKDRVVHN